MAFVYPISTFTIRLIGWSALAIMGCILAWERFGRKRVSGSKVGNKIWWLLVVFLTCTTLLSLIYSGWEYRSIHFIGQCSLLVLSMYIAYHQSKKGRSSP